MVTAVTRIVRPMMRTVRLGIEDVISLLFAADAIDARPGHTRGIVDAMPVLARESIHRPFVAVDLEQFSQNPRLAPRSDHQRAPMGADGDVIGDAHERV